MRGLYFLFISFFIVLMSSCRTDLEFQSVADAQLRFSKDTVYLDTVFTGISSSTYSLKVYNTSDKNIRIPSIRLGKGQNSNYRLMVDGMQGNNGKEFTDVEMLAKDSLFIFIETTTDISEANPDDFLYTDQILFGGEGNFQKVELVTLIQDAVFLYPSRDEDGNYETIPFGTDPSGEDIMRRGFMLSDDELTFTDLKPYVIYGYAGIGAGKTLNILPGARVHFHTGSAILAYNGSILNVQGQPSDNPETLENEVIFEGDRLEPEYADLSGQWDGIIFAPGSRGIIQNLTIKNATIGLYAYGHLTAYAYSLDLVNVQVYNSAYAGIYGQAARIRGKNVVVNTSGVASLACIYGGKYNFTHSTFNNSITSANHAAVLINNYIQGALPETNALEEANFTNCIIYGFNGTELVLNRRNLSDTFQYAFKNCLLKVNPYSSSISNNPLYALNDSQLFSNCLIAEDAYVHRPHFWSVVNNNLNIKPESAAVGRADAAGTATAPVDINHVTRPNPADIGAYQARTPDNG